MGQQGQLLMTEWPGRCDPGHSCLLAAAGDGILKCPFSEYHCGCVQSKAAACLKPQKFIQALEERGAQLEEESEDLCSQFMAEDIPVDAFVDRYLKLRIE
eukprot:scaffold610719_cov52-Prasinocladus_malaysianus.AAC.1